MKNDLIFIPILKNKAVAEPKAIEACSNLFSSRVIPYIEIINEDESSRGYKKTKKSTDNILHFEQIYRKKDTDLQDIINKTKNTIDNEHTIYSIIINSNEIIDDYGIIKDFITYVHSSNHNCALRIPPIANQETIKKLFCDLYANDYLIIDIDDNDYSSLDIYFSMINNLKHECYLIAFSDERPKNSTNKSLAYNDYNHSFNTSVIDNIKNDNFVINGFGSYCSAKNDLNQGGTYAYHVYGAFVAYNYDKNDFFSFKTEEPDCLPKAYKKIKSILKERVDIINDLFQKTNISFTMVNEFLSSEKNGTAAMYISISIVHYIEEIVNGLLS